MKMMASILKRRGFTLTEVMVALSLSTLVILGTLQLLVLTTRQSNDGLRHLNYNEEARRLEQTLTRCIHQGKALSVYDNYVEVLRPDSSTTFTILFEDDDDDPETAEDNRLVYDPNGYPDDGDEIVICEQVTVLEGHEMFEVLENERNAVQVNIHIGDVHADNYEDATGALRKSSTGVQLQFVATPRNTWDWRQSLKYR